jgi:hypothetical protein
VKRTFGAPLARNINKAWLGSAAMARARALRSLIASTRLWVVDWVLFLCSKFKLINQCINGGGEGIRTLETVARLHTFQACAFDHSATPPARGRTIAKRPPDSIRLEVPIPAGRAQKVGIVSIGMEFGIKR